MSRCSGCDDAERSACEYYFPAGPWSNGCMHHREEFGGHCDNIHAQIHAQKRHPPCT
jgi:hypothetical protein